MIVNAVFADYAVLPGSTLWLGALLFTIQIYGDFSGYSDIAVGTARLFGFKLMRNFNVPYFSRDIAEFWRRWHISLTTWFRDYVYIPLGGNRVKPARMYLNLFAVWFLTGLWHGASLNFILWGLYYFVLLVIEKRFLGRYLQRLPAFFQHLYALLLVMIGWVLFYFDGGVGDCFAYLGVMFGRSGSLISAEALNLAVRYIPILLVAILAATPLGSRLWKRIEGRTPAGVAEIALCLLALALCTAVLASQSYNPFLYFKF